MSWGACRADTSCKTQGTSWGRVEPMSLEYVLRIRREKKQSMSWAHLRFQRTMSPTRACSAKHRFHLLCRQSRRDLQWGRCTRYGRSKNSVVEGRNGQLHHREPPRPVQDENNGYLCWIGMATGVHGSLLGKIPASRAGMGIC